MFVELLTLTCLAAAVPLSSNSDIANTSGFNGATIAPSRGGSAICVSGIIPITASAMNLKLNLQIPQNQSQVTGIFVDYVASGSTLQQQTVVGRQNVSGTYNIGASLCVPANGTTKSAVQVLSHGIGFDRYYWDFATGYSYVDYAAQQGYATLAYDRLGAGKSARPDPVTDVQSPLELAILAQLIRQLRDGKLTGKAFRQVIGVGHSFGSILTQGITNTQPQLLDAAVLTGFSINSTGSLTFLAANDFTIASQNSPYRFTGISNGYLVSASAVSNQIGFFKTPSFDPEIVAATDAQKQTLALGELFSQGTVVNRADNFTGAVAVVNGANDLVFCDGNCSIPGDLQTITRMALYPAARNVTSAPATLSVPLTGHGLNLHYTANTAYQFIHNYLKAAGL